MKHLLIILFCFLVFTGCSKDSEEEIGIVSNCYGYVIFKNGDTKDDLNIVLDKDANVYQVIKPGMNGDEIGCKYDKATYYYSWSDDPTLIQGNVKLEAGRAITVTIEK